MFTWVKNRRHLAIALVALALAGFGFRVGLWWLTEGSNDIRTWQVFATVVSASGLATTYELYTLFNHPPTMGLLAAEALELARDWKQLSFAQVFKLPSLLAEACTGLLLFDAWRLRGRRLWGLGAMAAYGLSLNCILISGHHGNTDAVYFCLAFAAAYLLEGRRSPFLAGLALGASINVKIIPVLLGLPLLSRCTSRNDALRFVAGASLGAVPFLIAFGSFDTLARDAFIRNIFMYRSNLEYWGVELAVRWLTHWTQTLPEVATQVRGFGNWYSLAGGKLLLLSSAALAGFNLWRSRSSSQPSAGQATSHFDAYQLCALSFALFLLFGSGFGVQYVGCVVAPLLASTLWGGLLFATTSGVFIGAVYLHFVVEWQPIFSHHRYAIPAFLSPLSILAWLSLVIACAHLIFKAKQARGLRRMDADRGTGGSSPGPDGLWLR